MGVGVMFVWQNAFSNTLIQFCAPDALRGRIMAVYSMTFQSFMRLGGLQAGFMADWLGVPLSLGIGAAFRWCMAYLSPSATRWFAGCNDKRSK